MATILVVEDDIALCDLLRTHLEADGQSVVQAFDGLAALAAVEQHHPDLILLDWMLSGMDGLAVCRRVRQKYLTPIIMLTARTEEVDQLLGLEVGADDYIAKPFSIRQAPAYILAGLRLCSKDIPGLLTIVGLFCLPPLVAVFLGSQPGPIASLLAQVLPWITIILGNISLVLAIEAIDAGQPIIPALLLPAALRGLPRYLWANGITTLLFWGIFTPLQWLVGLWTARLGWPWFAPTLMLLLPMLFWHVHLVFATYAAVIDNHSGIRSVLISIRLTNKRWFLIAAAFAGSVLIEGPIAAPLYLLILHLGNPLVADGFTWILVMAMRPIFVATLHKIYEDFRPTLLSSPKTWTPSFLSHRNAP